VKSMSSGACGCCRAYGRSLTFVRLVPLVQCVSVCLCVVVCVCLRALFVCRVCIYVSVCSGVRLSAFVYMLCMYVVCVSVCVCRCRCLCLCLWCLGLTRVPHPSFPSYYVRGLLIGVMRMEISGDVTISCRCEGCGGVGAVSGGG